MRILHVTFDMGIGGTEQVIRQLVLGLDGDQIENEIFCIDGHVGPIGEQLRQHGVTIHTHTRRPGLDLGLIGAIRKVVAAGQFDIVHCHQYTPYFYGVLAARWAGARAVFTEHGRFHPDTPRYKAVAINPILALLTSRIVAISQATGDALVKNEFLPRSRIEVIYNGISGLTRDSDAVAALRSQLCLPDHAFVFGTVSRLDPVKNQSMMLRAFHQVLRAVPNAYLLVVGDGPERKPLEDVCTQLSISERVRFTGFVERPADHLASMDVFLLSSYTEGTSMTLLEAMSLGIPQVVTDVGGNPEIVRSDETGFLTPSDDEDEFACAMIRLSKHPDLRMRMAQASLDRFQQTFRADAMVNRYLQAYRGSVHGAGLHV